MAQVETFPHIPEPVCVSISDSWGMLLRHPTDRTRPAPWGGPWSGPEIAYIQDLNLLKREFLDEIGIKLERSFNIQTEVDMYGDGDGPLGYILATRRPFLGIIGKRYVLASIGTLDKALGFSTTSDTVSNLIERMAPRLEAQIAALETHPSGADPQRVFFLEPGWIHTPGNAIEEYLLKKRIVSM